MATDLYRPLADFDFNEGLTSWRWRCTRHSHGSLFGRVTVVSAVAIDSTHVRVNFGQILVSNVVLTNPDHFVITSDNDIEVLAVTPDSPLDSVVLTTTEHLQGGDYNVEVLTMEPAGGPDLSADYTGIGVAPTVSSAVARNARGVRVTFSEAMAAAGLTTPGNYTIVNDVGSAARTVSSVAASDDRTYVDLTLDGQLSEGTNNYDVEVAGVTDAAGNALGTPDTATFSFSRRNSDVPDDGETGESGGAGQGDAV